MLIILWFAEVRTLFVNWKVPSALNPLSELSIIATGHLLNVQESKTISELGLLTTGLE